MSAARKEELIKKFYEEIKPAFERVSAFLGEEREKLPAELRDIMSSSAVQIKLMHDLYAVIIEKGENAEMFESALTEADFAKLDKEKLAEAIKGIAAVIKIEDD